MIPSKLKSDRFLRVCSENSSKKRRMDKEKLRPDESEDPYSSPEKIISPVIVFAHGAGAPSSSEWMIRWKEMMKKTLGAVEVVTFDYPYRYWRSKAEKLIEIHMELVKETAARFPGHPLILAAKSMGSFFLFLDVESCGLKGAIRDETLLAIGVPVMFVQGSKDPMCPLDKLDAVCNKMKAVTDLHVIDGGDHSFKIGKKHLHSKGLTQDDVQLVALQAIAAFVSKSIAESLFD